MWLGLWWLVQIAILRSIVLNAKEFNEVGRVESCVSFALYIYRLFLAAVKNLNPSWVNGRDRETRILKIGVGQAVDTLFCHGNLIVVLIELYPFIAQLSLAKEPYKKEPHKKNNSPHSE